MAYLVGGKELCSEFWQIQVQTYLTSKRLIVLVSQSHDIKCDNKLKPYMVCLLVFLR